MATEEHGLDREKFAYDSGPHGSFDPNQASADVAVQNMEDCCREIKTWMSSNKLKLNDEKTEAILCGSKAQRVKVSIDAVCVGDSQISFFHGQRFWA